MINFGEDYSKPMIIKSKSRKRASFKQLLEYMQAGKDEHSMVLTHNLTGQSVPEWTKDFEANEGLRLRERKGSVRLYHELLSFHDRDTEVLNQNKLEALTAEYIRNRAYNGLVVAMSHHDRNHVHVHLCISGVEYATGKSMRISQKAFDKVKRDLQSYQIEHYPELSHSIVAHGSGRSPNNEKEYQLQVRTNARSKREDVKSGLEQELTQASSLQAFLTGLERKGIEPYYRNGIMTGVRAHGYKFRLSALGVSREELRSMERSDHRLRSLERIREKRMFNRQFGDRHKDLGTLRRELRGENQHDG